MTSAEGSGERARRRVGTMVRDKYRIDAYIATGSMATVYAATHRNGSRVALKILHGDLARDPTMAERFKREGYFANAIGHSGVVRAIDDDIAEDGCAFIVMELLEGENLEQRRQRAGGKLPVPETLEIADAVLDVLSAAHDHEVLHRDLKPENVFVTRKNEVKLLDFGVARFNDGRSSSEMTGVGMVLGTPAFMPPEQALGRREEVDTRSDIWSVGATLFFVMTGEAVHAGGDAKTKLIATARTPARPIRDVAPEVPRAVASVIDRALAFDKVERWADANAMREALRWARMSLDGEVLSQLEPESVAIPAQAPTRETKRKSASGDDDDEDGPTLARAVERRKPGEETARLHVSLGAVKHQPVSNDVITRAPPVTRREDPPSTAMSQGPTLSLRADPGFSLRRYPQEPMPSTQRMPGQRNEGSSALAPAAAKAQAAQHPAAIFQASRANDGFRVDNGDAEAAPRLTPRTGSVHPTHAAGAQAYSAPPPPLSGPPPYHSAPPPKRGATVVMTAPGMAPRVGHPSSPPGIAYASAPPSPTTRGSREASAAAGFAATQQAGPLLATIVPARSNNPPRVLLPILIGLVAAAVTYGAVARRRSPHFLPPVAATTPAASVATSPSAATSAAPPGPAATTDTTAAGASSTAPVPAAASSIAADASSAPPKKRPRPRPKPVASGAPATQATATEVAPPEPAPAPAPAPTPNDTLPKKEPE